MVDSNKTAVKSPSAVLETAAQRKFNSMCILQTYNDKR
jgi:hypothetical protein